MSTNPIKDALDELARLLALGGVENVTRDPNTFYPNPVGVLITSPIITAAGMQTVTMTIDILIVSAQRPDAASLDAMFPVVLNVLELVQSSEAQPTTWGGGPNTEPLAAYSITATITTPV